MSDDVSQPSASSMPSGHSETGGGESAWPDEAALGQASALLSDAIIGLARVLLRRGRSGARRAATASRVRLDLRQLTHDRDAMVRKLGREVCHLVEGGEVQHPGLVRGAERIKELDRRISAAESAASARGTEAAPDPTAPPDAPAAVSAGEERGGSLH